MTCGPAAAPLFLLPDADQALAEGIGNDRVRPERDGNKNPVPEKNLLGRRHALMKQELFATVAIRPTNRARTFR